MHSVWKIVRHIFRGFDALGRQMPSQHLPSFDKEGGPATARPVSKWNSPAAEPI